MEKALKRRNKETKTLGGRGEGAGVTGKHSFSLAIVALEETKHKPR